jgi:hypothetical protein
MKKSILGLLIISTVTLFGSIGSTTNTKMEIKQIDKEIKQIKKKQRLLEVEQIFLKKKFFILDEKRREIQKIEIMFNRQKMIEQQKEYKRNTVNKKRKENQGCRMNKFHKKQIGKRPEIRSEEKIRSKQKWEIIERKFNKNNKVSIKKEKQQSKVKKEVKKGSVTYTIDNVSKEEVFVKIVNQKIIIITKNIKYVENIKSKIVPGTLKIMEEKGKVIVVLTSYLKV